MKQLTRTNPLCIWSIQIEQPICSFHFDNGGVYCHPGFEHNVQHCQILYLLEDQQLEEVADRLKKVHCYFFAEAKLQLDVGNSEEGNFCVLLDTKSMHFVLPHQGTM